MTRGIVPWTLSPWPQHAVSSRAESESLSCVVMSPRKLVAPVLLAVQALTLFEGLPRG